MARDRIVITPQGKLFLDRDRELYEIGGAQGTPFIWLREFDSLSHGYHTMQVYLSGAIADSVRLVAKQINS